MKQLKDIVMMLIRPEERSLKRKSMRAAFWSMVGRGGSRVLRLVSSLVLTRILFPEAFGLMATANVFLAMIQLFADTGVRTAIIQNPKGGEAAFLNTAWIISICRGLILFAVIGALAWPLAGWYHQPELKGLLLVMALNPLIGGFENPALALFIKSFRVEKQVAYELGTHLLGIISSIVLAWILRSVYALALGSVSQVLYRVIASYLMQSYRPRFSWDRTAGSEIFHFGKYIFLNTMISWAVMNGDILLIGRLLDMDLLGVYNLGANIGEAVGSFCLLIFMQSFMPAVSSVTHDLPRVMRIYRRTAALVLALAVPVSVVVTLFSSDIIRLLYDPRYQLASIAVYWVSLGGIFRVIGLITGNTFIAMGKPVYETLSMAVGIPAVGAFVSLGALKFGLTGAAFGMFSAVTIVTIAQSVYLIAGLKFGLGTAIRPWLQAIATTLAIVLIYSGLKPWMSHDALYNLPFLGTVTFLGLGVSGLCYRLMEGPRPFHDRGGATRGGGVAAS